MEQQSIGNGIALINFERAYANSVVSNGSYHWYLRSSKWQRQLYISFNVCYGLIWWIDRKEYIHFVCRPMLVYSMTLVCLWLFHKNLGKLRELFERVVHSLSPTPPPWQKVARSGTHDSIGRFDPLLNITDSSVIIHKLRQDKSGQALRSSGERFCGLWSAWYHVYLFYTAFMLILRWWDIFSSPKSVFVYQWYKL